MKHYFDTGVLLKLYTPEASSPQVRDFVVAAGHALPFLDLHRAECASVLHLKASSGECSIAQANRVLEDIEEDLRSGVLRRVPIDQDLLWTRTLELIRAHAATTGCRTLESLHVAAALTLGFRHFVTSDTRQYTLATRAGLVCPSIAAPLPVLRQASGVRHPSLSNREIDALLGAEDSHVGGR